MASMDHIIYLSSDEDDDKLGDYTDLLAGVLESADEKRKPKNTGHRKSNSSNPDDDGDDDCVVLDGDPFKTKEKETSFDTFGETDDEILVVGQKGEIACRDFPHPRHACAKFPFKSTSHEKYCDMCHCYACDIRAPCPYWCVGFSTMDHCHANDKEQIWKNHRECIRTGEKLPLPAPAIAQLQQLSPSQSIRSPQNSLYYTESQFGIRACSASTRVRTRPNTYIRPGYRTEQSRTFPQNPGLQPRACQLIKNHRGGSYDGNPSPQVVSSDQFTWTQRPSRGANLLENGVHNVAQGSQYTGYAPPAALQGNSQRTVTANISTVPESRSKVYARQFSQNMYPGSAQTSAVPSETPNPPANHQQRQQPQPGRSNDKVLSEFEDWFMDDSTLTDPVCLLSGQDNATTFPFDLKTFIE